MSMMKRVSGDGRSTPCPHPRCPSTVMLTESRALRRAPGCVEPGSFGSRFASFVRISRMPTAPGVCFQSAMIRPRWIIWSTA